MSDNRQVALGLIDELLRSFSNRGQTQYGGLLSNMPTDFPIPGDPNAPMGAIMPEPPREYGLPDPSFDWSLRGTNPLQGKYRITGTYKW